MWTWQQELTIITAPAQSIINSATYQNNQISVIWSLADTTGNISGVTFELLNKPNDGTVILSHTITGISSGTFIFDVSGIDPAFTQYENYQIRTTSYYNGIYSVGDGGGKYEGYFAITSASDRPTNWVWGITSSTTLPTSSSGIHPVTAADWNAFTAKIDEFRNYLGMGAFGFDYVSAGADFKTEYNKAIAAIRPMTSYTLSEITTGTRLSAALFTQLDNAIASIP